jgi:hypothetical protein
LVTCSVNLPLLIAIPRLMSRRHDLRSLGTTKSNPQIAQILPNVISICRPQLPGQEPLIEAVQALFAAGC